MPHGQAAKDHKECRGSGTPSIARPRCDTQIAISAAPSKIPGKTQRPVSRILCPKGVWPFILETGRPAPPATYPETSDGPPSNVSLFGLAPDGVCHAFHVAMKAVSSYLAISPLPLERGGIFSVALSPGRPAFALRTILPCGVRTFLCLRGQAAATQPLRLSGYFSLSLHADSLQSQFLLSHPRRGNCVCHRPFRSMASLASRSARRFCSRRTWVKVIRLKRCRNSCT